jgi:hypothetical protein
VAVDSDGGRRLVVIVPDDEGLAGYLADTWGCLTVRAEQQAPGLIRLRVVHRDPLLASARIDLPGTALVPLDSPRIGPRGPAVRRLAGGWRCGPRSGSRRPNADLRHSVASILLARGVHPKVVSDMLGHASIALTLDTYSHVIPSLQQEAANVVAAAVLDPAATAPQPGPEGQVRAITSGS